MANIIGIDLGTTFSAVAKIDETGRPVIVHNQQGQNITPSVVFIEKSGRPIVGETARKEIGQPCVFHRFKRDMGSQVKYEHGGNSYTPTDLSALVLKELVEDATKVIGKIDEVVVTIPANFSNEAREATMSAAVAAGLNVKYIINEPTAAALYYAFKSGGSLNGTYAVYDFGGGTFDVSIISVKEQNVEVITSNGIARLGGKDIDEKIRNRFREKYKAATGEALDDLDFTLNDAEREKITLSTRENVLVRIMRQNIALTRVELEELISTEIAQAELLCETTLAEANLTPDKITKVFLVGGTTRIPAIRESVKRVFLQEPEATVNVDEVVALGAALYAAVMSKSGLLSATQQAAVSKLSLQERTSKSFGTTALITSSTRGQKQLMNSIIIPKNTAIPASETKTFITTADNQTKVECDITECVEPESDPQFVNEIWKGMLTLPAGRKAGCEIKVTYAYDANQIMQCAFVDVESGARLEYTHKFSTSVRSTSPIDAFTIE